MAVPKHTEKQHQPHTHSRVWKRERSACVVCKLGEKLRSASWLNETFYAQMKRNVGNKKRGRERARESIMANANLVTSKRAKREKSEQ